MDERDDSPRRPDEPVVLERSGHSISRRNIDPDALNILYRLHRHGFIAYLCGGAVRDLMLGKPPKDFDIVTDARPGQIKKRFSSAYIIGRRFRLAHIHFPGGKIIEVATFRRDIETVGENAAEAAPDPTDIYGTPREDAFRRDITINALFYDPVTVSVIDYVGGLEDLARRRVRVIGEPEKRFTEDPVRIWRVLRYAARLGFDIEEDTEKAIYSRGRWLASVSGSRLYEEINKDLASETRSILEALRKFGILKYILGRAGEDYEADSGLFSRLTALLDIIDRALPAGFQLSLEEMYSLVFWPWLEPLFAGARRDMHPVLNEAFANAGMQVTIPRSLRANVVQTLIIAAGLIRALHTGRMRWSLQRRSQYGQAVRLFFLIEKGRAPENGESFDDLYRQAFPSGPRPRRRRTL